MAIIGPGIQIFTGSNGGGGGGTVHTALGLSGDGSIATPVVLGGTIPGDGTNVSVVINSPFGTGDSVVRFEDDTTGSGWSISSNGVVVEVELSSVAFDFSENSVIRMIGKDVSINSNAEKQFRVKPGSGWSIEDDLDSVGLIGSFVGGLSRVYPNSGDPAQYVQFGNIPASSGLTNANSGLSVFGGNTARLGGALLAAATINTSTFQLTITATGGGVTTRYQHSFAGMTFNLIQGVFTVGQNLTANSSNSEIKSFINDSSSGNDKFISLKVGQTGIVVEDTIDNVGLIGTALFPVSGSDQYAQYGNLTIPQNFALPLGSGNRTALTYAVTGGDACIQVNCSLSTSVAGTGCDVFLNYTDINGNPKSLTLTADGGVIGNYPAATQTIEAQNGTNVTVDAVASGGNVYRVTGAIVRFF